MDNQQQQQTIIAGKSVGEILALGAGLAIIGLGALWGLKQVAPEILPKYGPV